MLLEQLVTCSVLSDQDQGQGPYINTIVVLEHPVNHRIYMSVDSVVAFFRPTLTITITMSISTFVVLEQLVTNSSC